MSETQPSSIKVDPFNANPKTETDAKPRDKAKFMQKPFRVTPDKQAPVMRSTFPYAIVFRSMYAKSIFDRLYKGIDDISYKQKMASMIPRNQDHLFSIESKTVLKIEGLIGNIKGIDQQLNAIMEDAFFEYNVETSGKITIQTSFSSSVSSKYLLLISAYDELVTKLLIMEMNGLIPRSDCFGKISQLQTIIMKSSALFAKAMVGGLQHVKKISQQQQQKRNKINAQN
jgi:hypothetical protein